MKGSVHQESFEILQLANTLLNVHGKCAIVGSRPTSLYFRYKGQVGIRAKGPRFWMLDKTEMFGTVFEDSLEETMKDIRLMEMISSKLKIWPYCL